MILTQRQLEQLAENCTAKIVVPYRARLSSDAAQDFDSASARVERSAMTRIGPIEVKSHANVAVDLGAGAALQKCLGQAAILCTGPTGPNGVGEGRARHVGRP